MKKTPLRQGMVNGIVSEVISGLETVREHAEVIMRVTECDRAKAYDAAFEIAIEGGEAANAVRTRYENMNCAEIASLLAEQPPHISVQAGDASPTTKA